MRCPPLPRSAARSRSDGHTRATTRRTFERPPFARRSTTTVTPLFRTRRSPCRHTIRVAERTTFISLCVLIDIANGLQARMHRRIVSLVYVSQLQVHTGTEYCVHMHVSTNMRRHCSWNGPSALSTIYYRQPHWTGVHISPFGPSRTKLTLQVQAPRAQTELSLRAAHCVRTASTAQVFALNPIL